MIKKILFIITILLIYFTGTSQNKIIVKVDTSAKIQQLTTNGNAGNVGITGGNSLTINVNDMDSVKTNEGLMSLTGSTAPYTYSSNTTGSTDLIMQQGTNITIVRSGNTLTFNSSGGGGGGGSGTVTSIDVVGSTGITATGGPITTSGTINLSVTDQTVTNEGLMSLTGTSASYLYNSNTTGSTGLTIAQGTNMTISRSGNTLTFNAAGGGGGGGSGTVTSIAIADGGGISVSGSPITTSGVITLTANDQSFSNELITSFSKPLGNTLRIVEAGVTRDVTISTNTPSEGQVLKWVSNQWQASTDLTGSGGGGGSTYTSGTGIIVDNTFFTISAIDASATNEIDQIGVSTSLSGGGRIMNYTGGFSNGTGTQLIINGSSASVSTSTNGGAITWTLPDASSTNELQDLTSTGNTFTLSDGGGSPLIAKSGTASDGKVLKWLTGQWVYGDDNNNTYTAGGGIGISGGNVISATDASITNELVTSFTKSSGNVLRLTDAGGNKDVNISNNTPYSGAVLKWDGGTSQWIASDDLTSGGGGGGGTYTAGVGISISGTDVISNTGDLSSTNEAQTLTSSGNTFILNAISGVGGGTVSIAKSGTASSGKVLKFNGTDWAYGDDDNTTYTAGSGLNLTGTQFTAVDANTTNEGLMSLTGTGPYTYNSNTSGSTPLLIAAGSGVSITRSVNTLTFASTVTDTDAQNLGSSASGTDRTITITGGTSTTFSVADNDNNSSNEIQSLTLGTFGGGILPLNPTVGGTGVNITQGSGIELVRNSASQFTINNTSLNTDAQNLGSSASGTDRTITITGGTSTTINVADNDNNPTNEAQTISKTGNVATLTNVSGSGGGTFNISQTVTPTSGQVLEWDGAQWNAALDDNTTYSAGSGLNLVGTTFSAVDISSTNEAQSLTTGTNQILLNAISGVGGGTVNLKTVNGTTILGSGDITVSSTNIYTTSGTIPTSTTRIVTIPSSSSLELGSISSAFLDLSNETAEAQLSYGSGGSFYAYSGGFGIETSSTNNTGIQGTSSGLQVYTSNGNDGTIGQVLTSNGTYAQWQTPTAPPLDGIATQSTTFATVANGGELPLFPGGSLSSVSSFSGNGFVKGVSTGVYEVNVVVNPTSSDADGFVQLGLYRSGTLVHNVKLYNHISGEAAGDVIYTFLTDQNSGTFTVRNTSGASIGFDIKRVTVKRVL